MRDLLLETSGEYFQRQQRAVRKANKRYYLETQRALGLKKPGASSKVVYSDHIPTLHRRRETRDWRRAVESTTDLAALLTRREDLIAKALELRLPRYGR